MPDYSEDELNRYFNDPDVRRTGGKRERIRGFWERKFSNPKMASAAYALSWVAGAVLAGVLVIAIFLIYLSASNPPYEDIIKPDISLATIAYTADGKELTRYHVLQNRSWAPYDSISANVTTALVATEDHRFYEHWGIDLFRTFSAVGQTVMAKLNIPGFKTQGGSTLTQQLARNLYRDIGFEQSVTRKMREWLTSVQIERNYTKREIIEMYLNTVEFGNNAYGIEAAAQTFYSTSAAKLDTIQGAQLVGMLTAISRNNPYRNPLNAAKRRNVVLSQMVKRGLLEESAYERLKDLPTVTEYRSSAVTASIAPHFALHVREWLEKWGEENDRDVLAEGLRVYTTIDSRLQIAAAEAVREEMPGLQAVVDYDWGRRGGTNLGQSTAPYIRAAEEGTVEPFAYFWERNSDLVDGYIKNTDRYREAVDSLSADEALASLRADEEFMNHLKSIKTRLETGVVAIDPRSGYVKVWVGGRDVEEDWFDHVAAAKRQPGSTFKPFVYTVAVDNGYSPETYFPATSYTWNGTGTCAGQRWSPGNMGGGGDKTLRYALASSDNIVTAQLVEMVNPANVVKYAERMGIDSQLVPDDVSPECYMSLALGTSDVTLLELTTAYTTLARGGIYLEPTLVTRIEDRFGNVLYEAEPSSRQALPENTAWTVIDIMRGALQSGGTAIRLRGQYNIPGSLDLAAKTGTTQNNADGWFMAMHPDLVIGSWVGFNDRRIAFRDTWWGQGAHNAMFVSGNFLQRLVNRGLIDTSNRFPSPTYQRADDLIPQGDAPEAVEEADVDRGRVGW